MLTETQCFSRVAYCACPGQEDLHAAQPHRHFPTSRRACSSWPTSTGPSSMAERGITLCLPWPRRSARARECCCFCSGARTGSSASAPGSAPAPTNSRCWGATRAEDVGARPGRDSAGGPGRWLVAPRGTATCSVCGPRGYARSLVGPGWSRGGLRSRVRSSDLDGTCWPHPNLCVAATASAGQSERTLVLAILRGALLDLLATEDERRTTRAVALGLTSIGR